MEFFLIEILNACITNWLFKINFCNYIISYLFRIYFIISKFNVECLRNKVKFYFFWEEWDFTHNLVKFILSAETESMFLLLTYQCIFYLYISLQ